ncbi:MAG: DUF935 domain-containing protein [Deferribacterales bacterium]
MSDGIYDANGNWLDFSQQSQMLDEYATRVTRGEVYNWLGTLPDPDPILRKLSQDDAVFDDLMGDDQVTTATLGRKMGTLREDYLFSPGKLTDEQPTPLAEQVHQMLVKDLENIDLYNLIAQLLDTPMYGMVPVELMWQIKDGYYRLVDLRPRPTNWFKFNDNNEPRFMTLDTGDMGKPLPKYKFVLSRHFPTYKNPYGLRLLSRCFWPVAFKRGGRKFWATFAERFGMPWVIGKYAKGTAYADKREMLNNLTNMVQDAVAIIPQGGGVELLSAGSGTGGQVHKALIDHMDAAISKVLQGQTLTSDVSQDGAAYSAGKVHAGTLEAYQAADRKLVKAAMEEISYIYTKLNMPDGVISPSFIWPCDEEEKQDDTSKRDTELNKQGVRFRKSYYTKTYNLEDEDIDVVATNTGQQGLSFSDSAGKKYTAEQQAIEDLVSVAVGKSSLKDIEKQVRQAVADSADYDDLMGRLAAMLPDLDTTGLQTVLEQAAVVSAGFGTTLDA